VSARRQCARRQCAMSVPGQFLRPMPSRMREGISAGEGERERERGKECTGYKNEAHRLEGILWWRCGLWGGGVRADIARAHIQCTIRSQTFSAPIQCHQPNLIFANSHAKICPAEHRVLETCRSLGCWCTSSEVGDHRAGNQL